MNQDKNISTIISIITLGLFVLWLITGYSQDAPSFFLVNLSIKDTLYWAGQNTDLVIIVYVFVCLQIAGFSEFRQGQDYLVVAFISIIFTPIGLLFIKNQDNEKNK